MKHISPVLLILMMCTVGCAQSKNRPLTMDKNLNEIVEYELATFGGGCFWCVEAVFQEVKGVDRVVSGYSGGHVANPSYEQISAKNTGHAEVCQLYFDPNVISYEQLLEIFWTTHDPTTLNRQGNDIGPQYRSIVLYHNESQRLVTENSIRDVAMPLWSNPVVTELVPFEVFYEAEDYHQNFYTLNPNYGYCRIIINPKVSKLREKFADLLKD